jgi:hypothetical protein
MPIEIVMLIVFITAPLWMQIILEIAENFIDE